MGWGARKLHALNAEADIILTGVRGRHVLDIGAWDGFFAFEAERRGAAEVLDGDHWAAPGPEPGRPREALPALGPRR